ncbi:hypothetical protein DZG00_04875 [Clavibacter lycopersici]|uniref:Uncharacterized protein n=1 Tax=Clavibacter lycopersici TaxID=2301718 RepID=A0A399T7Z6_9MICO|nr:hypothetical protein [Clavibacter lycopersici]RIJ52440.1 hypothetical protein DZG00_04875 [Clavibacter lycopersici]RIJ61672.1 hypothetical protein DZG02_05715 [Clavibacter lycopersici]
MKHITYAEKSLLVGDATADALLEYAAALSSRGRGESVTVHAISSDGDEVDATFLLGAGAPFMAETTTSTIPEPDNEATVDAIRADLQRMQHPESVSPDDGEDDHHRGIPGLSDI